VCLSVESGEDARRFDGENRRGAARVARQPDPGRASDSARPVPNTKDTALTIASEKGHVKFFELLIQYGAMLEVTVMNLKLVGIFSSEPFYLYIKKNSAILFLTFSLSLFSFF
jgi:hypothetical protein